MRRASFALFALLLTAAACRETAGPEREFADLRLRTVAESYAAGAEVGYVIRHRAGSQVGVDNCGDRPNVLLERQVGSGWETLSSVACRAVYEPFLLQAGGELRGRVTVAEPGSYRLRVRYYGPRLAPSWSLAPGPGGPLRTTYAPPSVVSNEFTVE
jgi:hypothetical protein